MLDKWAIKAAKLHFQSLLFLASFEIYVLNFCILVSAFLNRPAALFFLFISHSVVSNAGPEISNQFRLTRDLVVIMGDEILICSFTLLIQSVLTPKSSDMGAWSRLGRPLASLLNAKSSINNKINK